MTSEAVKVIVRCRPLNTREKELKSENIVGIESSCAQCSLVNPNDKSAPPKTFSFDGAYYIDSATEQIYNEIVFPIVESVTEGYNGTVFAYGQTGCGKSFTMQGINEPAHRGIIPRAFEHIFEAIATTEKTKFLVQASYLEIYNEEIRDLLGTDSKKKLDLKENNETGVYVSNLSMHIVNDVSSCEKIMEEGWKNRSVGATLMNADSSRSHSIFTIYIERISTEALESDNVKFGKLNLVDLAGSERQTKTGATGDRLKEATKINLSLSALGNVISALVDGKSKHIPFRDSKLTRLLQDSLGGNTKTLMVACISPADNNYDETLSTLRYANRAKNIKNKPKINEDPKDALLRQYKEEILELKKLVGTQGNAIDNSQTQVDENVIEKIKQDYDMKIQGLVKKYEEDIDKLKSTYEHSEETAEHSDGHSVIQQMEKLQAIEESMVGGEKANDAELKEKRAKKKKIAEAKLNAIHETASKLNDDDRVLLRAYGDITEELRAKSMLMKKAKRKIQSLEQEVRDLQSEFEAERTDYLETIRRQDKQIKLFTQVFEKIQPFQKEKCRYRNVDEIRTDSRWDDNSQQWVLPQLSAGRLRFPPAIKSEEQVVHESSHSRYKPDSPTSIFDNDIIDIGSSNNSSEDKLLTKLNNSDNVEIVTNYFMPKRREQLLNNLHKLKLNTSGLSSSGQLFENGHHPVLGLSKSANQIGEMTNNKMGEKALKLNEQLNNSLSRKGLGVDGKYNQDK